MSDVINQAYVIKAHKAIADAQATLKAETDKPAATEKNPETEEDKLKAIAAAQKAVGDAENHLSATQKVVESNDLSEADPLIALGISGVTDTSLFSILKLPSDLSGSQKESLANAKVAITGGKEQWSEIEDLVRHLNNKAGAQFKLKPVAGDWPDRQNGVALRQSVSRDFLFDAHAMPGVMRIGPDLSNVGNRIMDDNAAYAHIYNAQSTGKSSHMPPYRYLFHRKEISEDEVLSSAAITVVNDGEEQSVEPGYAVTPTVKAKALLAFLKSLRTDSALPEAPLVKQASASPSGTE